MYVCICMCICIYIYMYIYRKETVRFDSFRFQTFRKFMGLVRFGSAFCLPRFDAVRLAFSRHAVARFGSVRFRVRFRPVPELNGSVRFGRFGSVSHFFLYIYIYIYLCNYIYIYIYTCTYVYIYIYI